MRLTFKITLFFIGGICLIMAWHGVSNVERETELFERQMHRAHYAIGQPLAVMLGRSWNQFGEESARALVDSANEADERVRVRWIWTEAHSPERIRPGAPDEIGEKLAGGVAVSWIDRDQIEGGRLYTYVPVVLDAGRVGALELSESFERQQAYVDDSRWHILGTTLLIVLMAAIVAWVTGLLFIARPVEALIDRARAIGRGEFDTSMELSNHGELTQLAGEMNLMSDQLVTARKRLEEESSARIAAMRQLRHADRLKTVGTLSAGLAHELGTPINVISMRSKMIESGEVDGQEARDNAAIINEQTERINKIIRKLMDFARIGSLEKEVHRVTSVVEEALKLVEPIADNKHVELNFDTDNPELVGEIDADQFVQVLTNLLVNAMHACEDVGGGHIDIAVREVERIHPEEDSDKLQSYVAVEVRDDGAGIADDDIDQIFEPFFTTKDVGEGSGLGLSVSYGIAREHGGWIEVDSQVGEGTTFTVILPHEEKR